MRLLAAGAAWMLALSAVAAPPTVDKNAVEQFARYFYVWGPNITVAVSDSRPSPVPGMLEVTVSASANGITEPHTFQVTPDGQRIFEATIYGIANPFAEQLQKLKTDLSPSEGTAGAPVVMVLFSDFQCSYCRQLAKTLQENLLKSYPNEVRLYFKDFPLDEIHPWSRSAAIAGRCVFRQDPQSFWAFHDWIFDKQGDITTDNVRNQVMAWAGVKGLDTLQLGRCYDGRATERDVDRTVAEGKDLQIHSTPTLFINGRPIPGVMPWQNLKLVIDFELDHQKKTGAGGEKCCEIRVSPLPSKKD